MKKKTKQEIVEGRVAKIPSRLTHGLYNLIAKMVLYKKYNQHITIIDDINECKGPCVLVFNHLSRYDHVFCIQATYPKRFNMVAGYNEFFRSHLHTVFKLQRIVPKKMFVDDISGLKKMKKIIRDGGTLCFSPEGTSSICGHNQPVVAGSGHLLKHLGVPVYFLKISGAYLTQHKICNDDRIGRVEAELKLLFSKEDLERLDKDEINDMLNEAFKHDDYEWNKTKRIKYNSHGEICKNQHDILYKCPKCGEEFFMHAEKDYIKCEHCGNGANMNDYYDYLPFDDSCVIPESPSKWFDWEREEIIKDIRNDDNYYFEEEVELGYLPPYKWVSNKKTSEPCGKGIIIIDHQGIHFKGTKLGEPFNFDLSYASQYTLPIVTDCTFFSLYIKGEYHEFKPKRHSVGKMLLLVEEMHRLHFNTWKNFKWCDYMYEKYDK